MDIQLTSKAVQNIACDALVVGAARTKTGQGTKGVMLGETARTVDDILDGLINSICADGEFKGKLGEMITVYTLGKLAAKRVVLIGLGSQESLTTGALRRASAIAARHLQKTGAHQIALALHEEQSITDVELGTQAQVEGALLGLYTFKKYQNVDEHPGGWCRLQERGNYEYYYS